MQLHFDLCLYFACELAFKISPSSLPAFPYSSTAREMPLPRRAVIAITSATAPLHNGYSTGLFIFKALYPY